MDVGTRQRGWVEGHGHGGSHSGKALGQGRGYPPPEPSSLCSWRAQDLWVLLVHLYHLGGDPNPSEPMGHQDLRPPQTSLVPHCVCWEAGPLLASS